MLRWEKLGHSEVLMGSKAGYAGEKRGQSEGKLPRCCSRAVMEALILVERTLVLQLK